jgi:hypothetical protein
VRLPDSAAVFNKWLRSQTPEFRSSWARMKNRAQSREYMELNTHRVQYKSRSIYNGSGQLICKKPTLGQRFRSFLHGFVRKATR